MADNINLPIERVDLLQEISDEQLAIAEVWICCEGMTLNNIAFRLDAIEKAIPSLYNKFLVAGNSGLDFMGHEGKDQLILGFFPKENNVRFKRKNGTLYLVANAIISKVYAEWAIDLFKHRNYREVSMEIIVVDKEDVDGEDWVTEFVFLGVTVLGASYSAACPGADITITKFSQETTKMLEKGNKIYSQFSSNKKEKEWIIPQIVKENAKQAFALQKEHMSCSNEHILSFSKYLFEHDKITESYVEYFLKNIPIVKKCSAEDPTDKEYMTFMLCGGTEGVHWFSRIRHEFEGKQKMAILKVDKKKEAMSDTEWGKVDKSQLKKDVIAASNFKTIAKDVFMLLEDGWEDGIEGSLKYPVMELKNDTLVYNRHGLSTALAMAKTQDESEVVSKVEAIMKKMGLDQDPKKQEQQKKEKKEFSGYTYNQIMDMIRKELSTCEGDMWVADADECYAYIKCGDGSCYKVRYDVCGNESCLHWDEKIPVMQGYIDCFSTDEYLDVAAQLALMIDETCKNKELASDLCKMASKILEDEKMQVNPKDAKEQKEKFEKEKKEVLSKCREEFKKKTPIADVKERAMMSDEEKKELSDKCEKLSTENKELKQSVEKLEEFKKDVEKEKKQNIVMATLADIKERCSSIDSKTMEKWKQSAEECKLEDIQGWKNSVYAEAFVITNGVEEKHYGLFPAIDIPQIHGDHNHSSGLWD